ncbi:MAG: ABC transporter permease [Bacteroidota bacterium]
MLTLIRIEWRKLKSFRAFWILWGLFFLVYGGMIYTINGESFQVGPANTSAVSMGLMSFPKVYQLCSWLVRWMLIIPGILMVINLSNEYNYRMLRQSVINGMGRWEFLGSKIFLVLFLSFSVALGVGIASLTTGFLNGGLEDDQSLTENMNLLVGVFLQACFYLSLASLITVMIKRSGIAIGVLFLYTFVLENILLPRINDDWQTYVLPYENALSLVQNPFATFLPGLFSVPSMQWDHIGLTVLYTALCWWGIYGLISRKDL